MYICDGQHGASRAEGGAISTCGEIVHFSNTHFHPKATAAAKVRVLPIVDTR